MKEQDFINIIKKQIGSEFIGDDCAFLKELGIDVFLITDCLINKKGRDISRCPQGGFGELMEYIEKQS